MPRRNTCQTCYLHDINLLNFFKELRFHKRRFSKANTQTFIEEKNLMWNKDYEDGFKTYLIKPELDTVGEIKFPFNGKAK